MNQTTHKMTDPIQIKHYKEDITSFNQLYKEFQRRFVRFANTYVRDLTGQRNNLRDFIFKHII